MTIASAETISERYARLRDEVGPEVTVVVATKYVPLEELHTLAEAGIEVVGENRAQELERKHAAFGDAFRWHFIGHLQSNKARAVNATCELVHSLGSESAARRLTIPALLEVNLSGEASKSGVPAGEIAGFLEKVGSRCSENTRSAELASEASRGLRSLAQGLREHIARFRV